MRPSRAGTPVLLPVAAATAATAATGAGCAVLALLAVGRDGALGAAVAVGAAILFFITGLSPLLLVGPSGATSPLALPLALGSYVVRLVLLAVVVTRLAERTGFDRRVFGLTVLACAATWTGATAWRLGRRREAARAPR